MTTILAHIRIHPGKEEKWEEIMQEMVSRTFSEESGVLRYEYFKGQQPNFYYCLLAFEDKWAFYRHQASDHHESQEFGAVIDDIRLEYLDPVRDANPLPRTDDEPLPANASAAMKRGQSFFPLEIARWWADRA